MYMNKCGHPFTPVKTKIKSRTQKLRYTLVIPKQYEINKPLFTSCTSCQLNMPRDWLYGANITMFLRVNNVHMYDMSNALLLY